MMDSPDGLVWLTQQEYGWYIAAYLFFSGLAGGAYLTGFAADLFGWRSGDEATEQSMRAITQWGVILALGAVAAGMFFLLFFHLGAPLRAMLFPVLFVNFGSWLVIGTWIIVLFSIVAVLQALWLLWDPHRLTATGRVRGGLTGTSAFPRRITAWIETRGGVPIDTWLTRLAAWTNPGRTGRLALSGVGSALALGMVAYTGLKLGYVSATTPLWDGTLLPFLFLASALSIGLAATIGVTALFEGIHGTKVTTFSIADDVIILGEVVVLVLLLATLASGGPGAIAAFELLTTEYGLLFWGGVVTIGLALPLALSVLLIAVERRADVHASERLGQLVRGAYTMKFSFVVLGGVALRYLVIAAAYNAPLTT